MAWRLCCLLLTAVTMRQTHATPLLANPTFSDIDLLAEDALPNAVYVVAPARTKRSPQFFGYHNYPPPGFHDHNPFGFHSGPPFGVPPGFNRGPPHFGPPDRWAPGFGGGRGPPGFNRGPWPAGPIPSESEPAHVEPTPSPSTPANSPLASQETSVPISNTTPETVMEDTESTSASTTSTTAEPTFDIDVRFGN